MATVSQEQAEWAIRQIKTRAAAGDTAATCVMVILEETLAMRDGLDDALRVLVQVHKLASQIDHLKAQAIVRMTTIGIDNATVLLGSQNVRPT
jgi:hypothetical protein